MKLYKCPICNGTGIMSDNFYFTDYGHCMKPYKCPVCNGTGIVSDDFYFAVNGYCSPTKICGHCQGSGIIWCVEDENLISNNTFGER